ncbi:aromatic amino acid lyase [Arthrobacter sp. NPDC090010]|uniref:aromatic amino acid lyase n=1 Tax=Arthrobacter sp. NPDC090010 TaxID=3363942 RepID=UPI00380A894C
MKGGSKTVLDGAALSIDQVLELGSQTSPAIEVAPAARALVASTWKLAEEIASRRPIYGRTTGVGANRDTEVIQDTATDLRLLRSHATGSGSLLPISTVRMALIIRLNQLLRGGSGIHPDVLDALTAAVVGDRIPDVRGTGPIGTGDLSSLGEIALSLVEKGGWRLHAGDALPFLSSSAVTLAGACATAGRLHHWIRMQTFVSALSFLAVRASREPLQPSVQNAHPHPGQAEAAAALLALLEEYPVAARRVQDSFGFRAYPQVVGALLDAASAFEGTIEVELVSAAENPLIDPAGADIYHNGNFHGIALALAAERVKLALASAGQLSVARLTDISNPEMTGLSSFLADTPGASGTMLLEYNQAAAQATLRHSAQAATLGAIVISRGVENHSSFSSQAIEQLGRCLESATDILACELLAALRAIAMHGDRIEVTGPLADFIARVTPLIGAGLEDRSLTEDLAVVRSFLDFAS